MDLGSEMSKYIWFSSWLQALQIKLSLFSKFSRNLGSMPNMSTHVLSTSRKHMTRSLEKSLGECCGSALVATACYRPTSHCIPVQKFVSVSAELNHNRSSLVLDSDKDVCCRHSSLAYMN